MNWMVCPGDADSGQQYPWIGRTFDWPTHKVALLG